MGRGGEVWVLGRSNILKGRKVTMAVSIDKEIRRIPRIRKIREATIIKGARGVYVPQKMADVAKYPADVKLCIERSRLVTESYKRTEGEPEIIRRAKAFSHLLSNMTIYIDQSAHSGQ